MLDSLMNVDVEPMEITLDYSNSGTIVALIKELIGKSGWLTVDKLTIDSFEREDFFLYACVTDEGKTVYADIAEKILQLPSVGTQPIASEIRTRQAASLQEQISAQRAEITSANTERNNNFFEEEMEKLDNWAEDVKAGLEKELRDLDAEIKLRKSESKKTSSLEDKVRLQRLIKDLEKKRSEKRLNLYQAQDDVDSRKETLLAKVEAMLTQRIVQTKLITFHWKII